MESLGVIYGGPSPEHDVSILTGLQAVKTLLAETGTVISIYWSKNGDFYSVDPAAEAKDFLSGVPEKALPLRLETGTEGGFFAKRGKIATKWEPLEIKVLINCCHGGPGEDGTLQGLLDMAHIRYTGPTASGAVLGMDKLAFEALMRSAGLPTLGRYSPEQLFALRETGSFGGKKEVFPDPPYILKPRYGGSSIGIEIVDDLKTAVSLASTGVHFRRGAVLETYRPDLYDLQIAVRSWPKLDCSVIEKPLRTKNDKSILDYFDKYAPGVGMSQAPREIPAQIDEELAFELHEAALLTADVTGLRGVARIDFLSDGKDFFVNEINTIPGSLSRHLFMESKINFVSLLSDLTEEALKRPAITFSATGSDGLVLRDATSIASKLA